MFAKTSETVGARVREAREKLGMSLGALARALSLSTPFVRAVELGHSPLPRGRAVDFARVLQLPVADLADVDRATLAVAIDALQTAGGCDRAVGLLRELGGGQ